MTKSVRERVWHKYNYHCAYCGKLLAFKDLQVDHIYPKQRGGSDDMENLNPSCRRCNYYKSDRSVEQFRDQMTTLHERVAKNFNVKVAIDYGIVELEPFDGKFYFEQNNINKIYLPCK